VHYRVHLLRVIVGTLAFIVSTLAFARASGAQWIVSAYGGAIHTQAADVRVQQPASTTDLLFADMPFESRSFESPIYYGYRVGHSLGGARWLFLEGELIHGKLYPRHPGATRGSGMLRAQPALQVPFDTVVQEFNMSHGLNFVLGNILVRRPITTWFTATGRAGLGALLPHTESVVEAQRRGRYEWAGFAGQLSGGGEARLSRRIAATAEYKWSRASAQVTVAEGQAALTTRSHHMALGLRLLF
jgi:hypothetical protein